MTATEGPVCQYLESRLSRRLREHGVVVWYDADRAFAEIVPQLELDNVEIVAWDGSWYALRHRLESAFANLNSSNLTGTRQLLVYVPAGQVPRQQDILLEVSEAGDIFNSSLRTVLRYALRDTVASDRLDEILDMPNLTVAEAERLALASSEDGPAPVQRIFGTTATIEVGIKLLTASDVADRVAEHHALNDVTDFLSHRFGYDASTGEFDDLQKAFLRYVLVSELLDDLTVAPRELANVPHATSAAHLKACRDLASHLRDNVHTQEFYAVRAREIQEDDLRLRELDIQPDQLGSVDTFPLEEELLLDSLANLVEAGRLDEAREHTEQRAGSFWTRVEPTRAAQWQAASTAIELIADATRIKGEVRSAFLNPAHLVRCYTGEQNWFRLDTLQRELERLVAALDDEFAVPQLLQRARSDYEEVASLLADRFLEAIENEGFVFIDVAMQTDTYANQVAPRLRTSNARVAYFLVDALRYEMAVGLADSLPNGARAELLPAIGVVPTITPLGMAALMPGAEGGVGIDFKGSRLAAEVGNELLPGSAERMKMLESKVSVRVSDMQLGTVLTSRRETLKRNLENIQLCIVRSQEIDAIGEADFPYYARRHMTDIVGDVKKAITILGVVGFTDFVIAADHGHLLLGDLTDNMKIDRPSGETLEAHRRCWIGRNAGDSDAYVRFQAEDLGMRGDVELVFPRGLAAFKARGGGSYMHGGLSPQELIVPVLTVTLPSTSETPDRQGDRFDLTPVNRITNAIFTVRVKYTRGLFTPPEERRPVQCVAMIGNQPASEILAADDGFTPGNAEVALPSGREIALTLRLRPPADAPSGTLRIVLQDAATGLELARLDNIEYSLAFI